MINAAIPVIYSTKSGTGEHERRFERMLGSGHEFFKTRCKGDVAQLSIDLVKKKKKLILLASGDTSIYELINTLMAEFGPGLSNIIGIIPLGTASNTAHNLGFRSANQACKLQRQFMGGKKNIEDYVRGTDLLKVSFDDTSLYAASSFNLGLLSRVCHDAEKEKSGFIASLFKKLRIKKISYAVKMIEASLSYDTFDAEMIYCRKGGEVGNFILPDIMNINMTNGKQQAAIKNWNPNGCPYDGELEMMCIQEMNLGKMVLLTGQMVLIGNHTRPAKDGAGYNRYGISYLDRLSSVNIRIAEDDYNYPFYIELDGGSLQLQKPNESVKADIVPSAMNFIYREPHR